MALSSEHLIKILSRLEILMKWKMMTKLRMTGYQNTGEIVSAVIQYY